MGTIVAFHPADGYLNPKRLHMKNELLNHDFFKETFSRLSDDELLEIVKDKENRNQKLCKLHPKLSCKEDHPGKSTSSKGAITKFKAICDTGF